MTNRNKAKGTVFERLWARVAEAGPDDCWEWRGYRNAKGRGMLRGAPGEGMKWAHRVAYESAYGPAPRGAVVRHGCDNPPCCNPAHLSTGTQADNVLDMVRRGRQPGLVVTDSQVREIRRRWKPRVRAVRGTGASSVELAREYGITPRHVRAIANGEERFHVEPTEA